MINEHSRISKMLFLLSNTQGYVRSNDMAEFTGFSERTIKKEIEQLKGYATSIGACVTSKRGCGYKMEIVDPVLFLPVKEQMDIRFTSTKPLENSYVIRTNEIIRFLIMADDYTKIDDIAANLHFSRSTIKTELREVREFLDSFGLNLYSRPGYGVKVMGNEYSLRLCMLEMLELHYHKAVSSISNSKYMECFNAAPNEKIDIRHIFLKTLRESGIRVTDMLTQRISMYLILLRNRYRDKKYLSFDKDNIKLLKSLNEYTIAADIIKNLQVYTGYDVDKNEIIAVELLLIMWIDLSEMDDLKTRYPFFHKKAEVICQKLYTEFENNWGVNLTALPGYKQTFEACIIPIVMNRYFGNVAKYKTSGPYLDDYMLKFSPLSTAFAKCCAKIIAQELNCHIYRQDINQIAIHFYSLIDKIKYNYTPRRLLICSKSGVQAGQIIKNKLLDFFSHAMFESIDVYDFYEVRGLNQDKYHCLLLNLPAYSYRYALPFIYIDTIPTRQQMDHILDEVLLEGYELNTLYNSFGFEKSCFYKAYKYTTKEAFLNMVSFKNGDGNHAIMALEEELNQYAPISITNTTALLIVNTCYTNKNCFEIYQCLKPGLWDNKEVRHIVFMSFNFKANPQLVRFAEHFTHEISMNSERLQKLINAENTNYIVDMVKDSIVSG